MIFASRRYLSLVMAVSSMLIASRCEAGYAFEVLADMPHAYWRFEETQPTDPADNETNDSTLDGNYDQFAPDTTPTLGVTGIPAGGTAVSFASNTVTSTPNSQIFISDPTDPSAYTIELWVKPNSIREQSVFVRTDVDPTISFSHQIAMTSSGRFQAYTYDGAARSVTGTTVATTGNWYHVVVTASSSGTMDLYVNGASEGSTNIGGSLWAGGDEYRVGSLGGTTPTWYDGTLDELALYTSVLSSTRIAAHYNEGITAVPEPSSFLLLAALCVGVFLRSAKRRK